MTPIERFKGLLDGKRFKSDDFSGHFYWDGKHLIHRINEEVANDEALAFILDKDWEWELYEEPKPDIKLTPKDIGKVVVRDDGIHGVIIEYDPERNYFHALSHWFDEKGKGVLGYCREIVDVLP